MLTKKINIKVTIQNKNRLLLKRERGKRNASFIKVAMQNDYNESQKNLMQ